MAGNVAKVTISGSLRGPRSELMKVQRAVKATARSIASELESRLASAFEAGGHQHRGGDQWAELKESTVKRKGREGSPWPNKPLKRFGGMSSATMVTAHILVHRGGVQWMFIAQNKAPYSGFHQGIAKKSAWERKTGISLASFGNIGFMNRGSPVVARPPLEFTEDDRAMIFNRLVNILFTDARMKRARKNPKVIASMRKFGKGA
jgi:phage gpG-like protein